MHDWADIAVLGSVSGLKGRFVARPVRGLPFLLEEGMTVHFVPPTLRGPRTARVARAVEAAAGEWSVEFEGISDRDAAEASRGSHCLVAEADLPEGFDAARSREYDLIGFSVVDGRLGRIGRLAEISEMPASDMLVVEGASGDILIPAVEEMISSIDDISRTIHVTLPDGPAELASEA